MVLLTAVMMIRPHALNTARVKVLLCALEVKRKLMLILSKKSHGFFAIKKGRNVAKHFSAFFKDGALV